MILSIVLIVLTALIAYWHYAQGFLTSAISVVCAVAASMMALGYYEVLVAKVFSNKMVDMAPGLVICFTFVLVYAVTRTLIDMIVPGNVRMPLIVDRIGAAVLGLVAGIFTTGTVAIAAQSLPFNPSIVGYARYEIGEDRNVFVPTERRTLDRQVRNEMTAARFDDSKKQSLLLPVDDWVLAFATYVSNGSLSGGEPLNKAHPDLLQEFFGQRVGIEPSAKRTSVVNDKKNDVKLVNVFTATTFPQLNDSLQGIRPEPKNPPAQGKVSAANVYLIVRVMFANTGNDADNYTRISAGSIRLNVNGENFYPVGTLHEAKTLLLNRMDDPIFVKPGADEGAADIVFDVPRQKVLAGNTVRDGIYIEIKRLARLDLSNKKIAGLPEPSPSLSVLRRKLQAAMIANPEMVAQNKDPNDPKNSVSTPPSTPAPVEPTPAPVPETPAAPPADDTPGSDLK